ncbi:MAG: hypothetical protein EOP86_01325 [Verrucomicrobiaceae bacterium]|nr:MAG: hypothetical protein EOP86_01325 [Verrucomicrobiaceae bacterium]
MDILSLQEPFHRPLRLISDLHLGHDISTVESAESLRPLIAGAGTLIFNGDTSQEAGTAFRLKGQRMLADLHRICAEEKVEPVFLKGNHDPHAPGPDLVDLAGGRATVIHGDILLPLISPWSIHVHEFRPALEKIHAEYSAEDRRRLEVRIEIVRRCREALPAASSKQKGKSLKALSALFFQEMWPPRRPWEVLKVWTRLPGIASDFMDEFRPQAEVLIFGHTHRPRVWRRRGRLLVNTGAFVTFASPLMVEFTPRGPTVHRVELKDGLWRAGPPFVRHSWHRPPASTVPF